jgi:hypothetical protein
MITQIQLIGNQCANPRQFYKYQSYYIQGLKEMDEVNFSLIPIYSRFFASLAANQVKGAPQLWRICNSLAKNQCSIESNHVGRYIFDLGSDTVNVGIDVADGKEIRDMRAYEWSDIYFKANKWERLRYPRKVFPIINGNGLLNEFKINQIKQFRNRKKEIDLIFMTVIYASTSGKHFYTNIEHHIRLFEALAELDCSKILKAIIPKQYSTQMLGKYLKRLDRAGVPWSHTWDGMSSSEFWDHLGKARVVFLRPGKHGCISWRMIDLLCMGACIVYDSKPHPNWPVPLVSGKNYVECGCGLDMEENLPPHDRYIGITRVVEQLLENNDKMDNIRKNNRCYFDQWATPKSIADYILKTAKTYQVDSRRSAEFIPVSQAS